MTERRHAGLPSRERSIRANNSRRGFRRSGVLIGAVTLLLWSANCADSNGHDCGAVVRGCVDLFNSIDRKLSVSATPPGTVVNLPAAIYSIYHSAIDEGLGAVAVDSTVDAATVFLLVDGGTTGSTVTCTVSSAAWVRYNPSVLVEGSVDGSDGGLTCFYW
jgi:hypothetical protein